ncbi:unnamed protein product [Rhodiola kirilowii]
MAMAFLDEEEVWRCPTHPSKRRMHGVCPLCLRDKLINLCQNCANVRPCDCPEPAEPTELKRSRSLVVSFLRSKSTHKTTTINQPPPRAKSSSFWSKMKVKKREKAGESDADEMSSRRGNSTGEEKKITLMMRSKSVGMALFGSFREGSGRSIVTTEKTSKGWFASPIKALKQSKAAKVNNENSPALCRG